MPYRTYTYTFASAATGTSAQFVGPHFKAILVASSMTGYNAAVGNATLTLRSGLTESDTQADVMSNTIATHTGKGIYPMANPCTPWVSVGFGTAVTGSAANTIDVVVYSYDF